MGEDKNMDEDKKNKKGLDDKCGSCILYFTNGILFSIGVILIVYGTLVHFKAFADANTPKIALTIPPFLTIALIVFGAEIAIFSGMGLFGTVCMRKAAKQMKTYNEETGKKQNAPCCATCTITLYIILTFIAFIFCLAGGILAVMLSTGMQEKAEVAITNTVEPYVEEFNGYLTQWVEKNQNGTSWIETMNLGKCCGWTNNDNNTIGRNNNAYCCNQTHVRQLAIKGDLSGQCNTQTQSTPSQPQKGVLLDMVLTCNKYVTEWLTKNLVPIYATLFALAFVCLACMVCAIVVRCALSNWLKKHDQTAPSN